MTFKDKYKQLQINYDYTIKFRKTHPKPTDEQIIVRFRQDLCMNIFGKIMGE